MKKRKEIKLRVLEKKLQSFSKIEVPETLKNKLFSDIPATGEKRDFQYHHKWYPVFYDFATTAMAAILILALIFTLNYGLSAPSHISLSSLHDPLVYRSVLDQNNYLYDHNNGYSTYIGKKPSYELQWPIANLNEPNY